MSHKVVLRPRAEEDLTEIYQYIAQDSPNSAIAYIRRLRARCDALAEFPFRGRPRDDIAPGLRVLAFERSAVVVYRVESEIVRIIDIFYRGRDYETILRGGVSDAE
jgi:toxin ParE1/3/4